ncbi:glycosyltransferase family 4 protein [Nocardiopsis halophila]|uniref:glycosyltransferase family 4 protein n=1 Tax=Nocardiopsis halophila TaxID=141692 RepID=UPI0003480A79|nr:glycosyltransferase family 4 protein [Nocardiopsis halophila]
MSTTVFIVPGSIGDPAAPSGGNRYDRRIAEESARVGMPVRELPLDGAWPDPSGAERARLSRALDGLPDGTPVLVDGLVACGVPDVLAPAAARLRLAVLVHLPLADEGGLRPERAEAYERAEGAVLRAADRVVATSGHAARDIARRHRLDPARVHTVEPGTDRAPLAPGTDGASRLLCVAAVTPRKGQDLLAEALGRNRDRRWTCVMAGPQPSEAASPGGPSRPTFAERVEERLERHGIRDRVRFTGALGPSALDGEFARADLVVLPSRAETYGMVVSEALARGIPVLVSGAGALPETVGRVSGGRVAGLLVPSGDALALAGALGRWWGDGALRVGLRTAARERRALLRSWRSAAADMARVLELLHGDRAAAEGAR